MLDKRTIALDLNCLNLLLLLLLLLSLFRLNRLLKRLVDDRLSVLEYRTADDLVLPSAWLLDYYLYIQSTIIIMEWMGDNLMVSSYCQRKVWVQIPTRAEKSVFRFLLHLCP